MLDVIWMVAIANVTPSCDRKRLALIISAESIALTTVYHLTHLYVTNDIQCGAYWYGILAHFVDCVGMVIVLKQSSSTGGISAGFQ